MKLLASIGREDIAVVYIVEIEDGKPFECVESVQPPIPRQEKWVLMVSTMYGCPINCAMCDAGVFYNGKMTADVIFEQIDFLVRRRYPNGSIPSRQFKIQFARMGEPSLNNSVLEVLNELPHRYQAPGLMPSISTVAPSGTTRFFEDLLEIKRNKYPGSLFQLQFSLHTTDVALRDKLIPIKKWSFSEIAEYINSFYSPECRKITLNFALAQNNPIEPTILLDYFDPEKSLIKITPINPTYRALEHKLCSRINPRRLDDNIHIVQKLRAAGYQVILSVGEHEENLIGSNCGQYLRTHLTAAKPMIDGYTYPLVT